jgi:hypothetical protein
MEWNGTDVPSRFELLQKCQLFFFWTRGRFEILGGKEEVVASVASSPSFSKHVTKSSLRLFLRKKKNQRAQISHHHHGNGRGARSEESERHHPNGQSSGTTGKEEERCRDGNFGEEESAEQTRRR